LIVDVLHHLFCSGPKSIVPMLHKLLHFLSEFPALAVERWFGRVNQYRFDMIQHIYQCRLHLLPNY